RRPRGAGGPATEGPRLVEVLLREAEGPRQAAAAGIDLAHLVARPAEGGHRRRGADHGLLVAVAVEERTTRPGLEAELEPTGSLAQQELLEEEAPARHVLRGLGAR